MARCVGNRAAAARVLQLVALLIGGAAHARPQQQPVVWQANVTEGALRVYADDSYELVVHNPAAGTEEVWLASAPTVVHVSGTWYASGPLANASAPYTPLTRLRAGAAPGGGWQIEYVAGSTPVTASFAPATPDGALGFALTFPAGAAGVNITTPVNATVSSSSSGPRGLAELASSTAPACGFPVFVQPPAASAPAAASLGYLTWTGRFFGALYAGGGGAAAGLAAAAVGAEGGPLVLFDGAPAAGPVRRAAVLSPWGHFKSTQLGPAYGGGGSGAATTAAFGINGYVTSLPAGFAVTAGVVLDAGGVTSAVHKWGAALRASVGAPPRLPDPASTVLSYWTDNGAYYDIYAYEPNITSHGVPEDVLLDVAQSLSNGTYPGPPLPARLLMLDAYWMYNTRADGNCKVNDTAWPLAFPSGLAHLASATGMGLIIYNGPQCGNSTYGAQWPLTYSVGWDQGWGAGVFSAVAAPAARAFYDQLFAGLARDGMVTFTQDFLDFQGLLFPQWLTDAEGNAPWMAAQAAAAADAGVPTQYCMGLASDILQAVGQPAVTNARASNDYGAGGENFAIGPSSLLLSALDLRASKDNFWSGGGATDRGQETSPHLQAVVAALSHGPVGFADRLGGADPAVLWPTCTLNGTLLHASRPATAVDAQFLGAGSGLPLAGGGDVRAAHAALRTAANASSPLHAYVVLAVDAAAAVPPLPAALAAADLWPPPPPLPSGAAPAYLVWEWNNTACATGGGAASDCVVPLGAGAVPGTRPPPPPDKRHWQLGVVVPVLSNGWALLGEPGKYVPLSPDRFAAVLPADGGPGIGVELLGAPGEAVTLAYVAPAAAVVTGGSGGGAPSTSAAAAAVGGTVKVTTVTLATDGRLFAILQ
jgi:hypothetical protein